jgi:hypothetical protein
VARPRKSTKDEWLDQFADWDTETQESLIDTCELLHRQTKRREGRREGRRAPETAPFTPGVGITEGLEVPALFEAKS